MTLDWSVIVGGLTLFSALSGAAFLLLRARLGGVFVTRGEWSALNTRLDDIEQRVMTMPNHQDIVGLSTRLSGVESGVAVLAAKFDGMHSAINRVEHTLDMLVQNQLEKEKG